MAHIWEREPFGKAVGWIHCTKSKWILWMQTGGMQNGWGVHVIRFITPCLLLPFSSCLFLNVRFLWALTHTYIVCLIEGNWELSYYLKILDRELLAWSWESEQFIDQLTLLHVGHVGSMIIYLGLETQNSICWNHHSCDATVA